MRIALVHGAWADGPSWAAVIRRLQAAGHDVIAPSVLEVDSSHVVTISHPDEVTDLILSAVDSV